MDKQEGSRGYFWPAVIALLTIIPLYQFRDEASMLHLVFRVVWSVVLIWSLVDIGRKLLRDLRSRRVSAARSERTRPPGEEL